MIIGINDIIKIYEYFYKRRYGTPKYKYKPSSQDITKIHTFLAILDKEYNLHCVGKVFLTNYFLFHFNRLKDQLIERFASKNSVGKILIQDIVGKKAFAYWKERNTDFDWVLQNGEFTKQYNIDLNEVHNLIEYKEPIRVDQVSQSEEIEKKRFKNTVRGFINCIEKTTLYNHRSQVCVFCKIRIDCKKVLQSNYPNIYQERGYAATH